MTRLKAKSAAESAIEYGASELAYRFTNKTSFPTDELSSNRNPLSIPVSAENFLLGSDIDHSKMSIQGGTIPPGEWKYFNPYDPANEFDPMRGRRVFVREIELYGKGEATTASGDSITAYATERFQVRDAPLFANAIFYNANLEINPGSNMDIYGPVHTNGDLYVGAKSTATLKFHDKVTASERFLHDEIRAVPSATAPTCNSPAAPTRKFCAGCESMVRFLTPSIQIGCRMPLNAGTGMYKMVTWELANRTSSPLTTMNRMTIAPMQSSGQTMGTP